MMKTNPKTKIFNGELAIDSIAEDLQRNQNASPDKDVTLVFDRLEQDAIKDENLAKKKNLEINLDDLGTTV